MWARKACTAGAVPTINPLVMTHAEWRHKRKAADSFAKRIGSQPKLFVIGDEHALR